jgi:hypothetical protein
MDGRAVFSVAAADRYAGAWRTSFVVWVLLIAQSATKREKVSRTTQQYSLPSPCRVLGDVGHPQLVGPAATGASS